MIIVVQRPPVSRSRAGEAKFRKDMVSCLIAEKDKIPHFHRLWGCDFDVHFHVPDDEFVLGMDNRNADPTLEVARDALVQAGVVASRFTTFRLMDVVPHSMRAPAVVFEVATPCSCCGIYIGPNHIETLMHFPGGQCICGYCNQSLFKFGFLNLRRTKERLLPDGRVVPLSALVSPGATVFDEDEEEPKAKPKPRVVDALEKEVDDFYDELLKLVNLLVNLIVKRVELKEDDITALILSYIPKAKRSRVK